MPIYLQMTLSNFYSLGPAGVFTSPVLVPLDIADNRTETKLVVMFLFVVKQELITFVHEKQLDMDAIYEDIILIIVS